MVFSTIEVGRQAHWAFMAGGSGGEGIYRTHMPWAIEREDGASVHLATTEARFMPD